MTWRIGYSRAWRQPTLYERWVLEPATADVLSGTLTSTWLLPPDCMHPCTVQFAIEARHGSR